MALPAPLDAIPQRLEVQVAVNRDKLVTVLTDFTDGLAQMVTVLDEIIEKLREEK